MRPVLVTLLLGLSAAHVLRGTWGWAVLGMAGIGLVVTGPGWGREDTEVVVMLVTALLDIVASASDH